MIRISFYTSHFFANGRSVVFRASNLQYFKYNNHIQDRKLVFEERNMDDPKNLIIHSVVFLNLVAH